MTAMDLRLDSLRPADARRCAELESLLFDGDDPWPAAAFTRAVRAADNRYVAARAGDLLIGYAGIARLGRTAPFEYEIHTIGVDPDYQRHGVGRRMMAELLDWAGPDSVVYLEVRTDNPAAIALYESLGFVTLGVRKRYYRSGADAYTMRRDPRQ